MDLKLLEYPRHVHGPGRAYTRVNSAAEAESALNRGWSLDMVPDEPPAPDEPLKRGPGRPKKNP